MGKKTGKVVEELLESALPERESKGGKWGWLLVGIGVGALSAYLLDPDRGRRRQALLRDQLTHYGKVVQREVPGKMKYVQDRVKGMQHEALGDALSGGGDSGGNDD